MVCTYCLKEINNRSHVCDDCKKRAEAQKHNTIGIVKAKSMFVNDPVTLENCVEVTVNGEEIGCNGFIVHENGNVVYFTTEPSYYGGILGDKNMVVMFRKAKNTNDFDGHKNYWSSNRGFRNAAMAMLTKNDVRGE